MDNPKAYAKGHSVQWSCNLEALDSFLPNLLTWSDGDPESILDIGCGDGEFTTNVLLQKAPKGSKILGVDISEKMVQYATEKYGSDNVDFKQIDLLGNPDDVNQYLGCFHKVFSFFCLHWVKDLRQPMENIHKIIRPGGSALLSFMISTFSLKMFEDVGKLDKWSNYVKDVPLDFIPYYANYSNPADWFSNLAKDVGFTVLNCETREVKYTFKTGELKATIKGVHPLLKFIPEEKQEDFLEESVKIFKEMHPGVSCSTSTEPFNTSYTIMVAHFQK